MKTSKGTIISGMIWSFAERMASQLVSVIVGIILARLLSPEEYGVISLVTIFITVSNVFVVNGFGTALIQKDEVDQKDFSTVFYFGIVFSLALYTIIYLLADLVADFYNMPILIPVLRVLALLVPVYAINSVQQAYVSRQMMFKKFFWGTLGGTVVSAVVGIGMAYAGFGVWALVGQSLTNTIVNTIILWFIVKWRPTLEFSFERLKQLFGYGWKIMIQALMNTLYGNLRSLVIGKVYSSEDLAFYNKGSQYPNLIVVNVDSAMSNALFPAMSKEQDDYTKIKTIARRTTKLCSFIMSPLLIGFAMCADAFVLLLFTEKWMPMIPYLRIICVCLLVRAAQTSTLQAIKATGRSDMVLKMDIPVRIVGVLAIAIAVKFGVIYVAISEVIVEYFGFLMYAMAADKIVGYKFKEILSDLLTNIVPAGCMGLIVWLIGYYTNFSPFLELFIQIISGIVAFIIVSIVFKNENFIYLSNTLMGMIRKKKV